MGFRKEDEMHKKLAALATAALISMVLPLSAFAAGSSSTTVIDDAGGGVSIQTPSVYTVTAQTLTAADAPSLAAQIGTLTATQDVFYFAVDATLDGNVVHDIDGTITITFPVGSQYNGTYATIYHEHADGSITSESRVVSNGVVSITVTDLSQFAVVVDSSATVSSNTSSTSPQTGVDGMMGIVLATGAVAIAAGVVALVLRKRVAE